MEWIAILKCPVTASSLRLMDHHEVELANKRASARQVWQADGTPLLNHIESGLISENGSHIYPILQGIVLLMKELAIVKSKDNTLLETVNAEKLKVKNFYNDQGWLSDKAGTYEDAKIYEDLREVSRDYLTKCHNRVNRYLKPTGKYMLDAASGAIQFDDYLQYSANYTYRVCVDFSFRALLEAKRKMGTKGVYILCDMTCMPFKDGVMDSFVSLNTIYHIPREEQVTAIEELYRLLAPGGKGVVVYDWFKHSAWMNFWMFPFRATVFIKNRVLDIVGKIFDRNGANRRLYFYAHPPAYFRQHLPAFELKVWRTLSVHFMRYYIHSWLFGKQLLNWVYEKEEKNPGLCGLKGEYPMLVFNKPGQD
ncbi:MAG: class I SAM-dependent methyltransferase [Chitinophagaceae bacterium]